MFFWLIPLTLTILMQWFARHESFFPNGGDVLGIPGRERPERDPLGNLPRPGDHLNIH